MGRFPLQWLSDREHLRRLRGRHRRRLPFSDTAREPARERSLPSQRDVMRQGPLTATACRPSRLPFNGCTFQPGMLRSETAVAAWSASSALLQRVCRFGCTFRLLPVSKSSRNPACRKPTITAPSVQLIATCRGANRAPDAFQSELLTSTYTYHVNSRACRRMSTAGRWR